MSSGIAFSVIGLLGEQWVGGDHAFEYLMLFGGLFIGIGAERMRAHKVSSDKPLQPLASRGG